METPKEQLETVLISKKDCPECKDLPEGEVIPGHDHRQNIEQVEPPVVKPRKEPFGRPTKLTQELVDYAGKYLDTCVDEEYEFHSTRGDKSDSYIRKIKVNLPSVAGFASYLDISRDTVYEWSKLIPETESGTTESLVERDRENKLRKDFSDIVDSILREQEKVLLEKGLSGDYNPTIAKLILTKHNYSDKTDVTSAGEKIDAVKVTIVEPNKDGTEHTSEPGVSGQPPEQQ